MLKSGMLIVPMSGAFSVKKGPTLKSIPDYLYARDSLQSQEQKWPREDLEGLETADI